MRFVFVCLANNNHVSLKSLWLSVAPQGKQLRLIDLNRAAQTAQHAEVIVQHRISVVLEFRGECSLPIIYTYILCAAGRAAVVSLPPHFSRILLLHAFVRTIENEKLHSTQQRDDD